MHPIPLQLRLPGGIVADYVAQSGPPAYTVDGGEPIAVDVVIPDDLAERGWHWHGSFLYCDGGDPCHPVFISTDTYAPPGFPSNRADCFTVARGIDLRPGVAKCPAVKPTKPKKTRMTTEPVQLAMEF